MDLKKENIFIYFQEFPYVHKAFVLFVWQKEKMRYNGSYNFKNKLYNMLMSMIFIYFSKAKIEKQK